MEENGNPRFPRAAGGLKLAAWAVIAASFTNQLYRWGVPLGACLTAIPGGILLAAGLYRAGTDEPGFYHALAYQAAALAVNQARGYLGYEFFYLGTLLYGAALLLNLRALNLTCAAASRLLSAAGRDDLAFLGGAVRRTNIAWYTDTLASLFLSSLLGMGFLLAAWLAGLLLGAFCLVFLFLAAKALGAGRRDHPTTI